MRTSALERLNIVWDPRRHAFERGLAHAAAYATTHGHLAAPVDVQHDGFALGCWLATQRKRAGQLTPERAQALHDLDPHWNPAWPLTWQRAYHAARHHSETDQPLGEVARTYLTDNGLRLGEWLHTQRTKLPAHPGQQELLTHLGLTSTLLARQLNREGLSARDHAFHQGLAAAQAFHAREGHLNVPQRHIEYLDPELVRLGQWISNVRRRWKGLDAERRQALEAIGLQLPPSSATSS